MGEVTIGRSDLYLDSVGSCETYNTGKQKVGEYWMGVCLNWVGLNLIVASGRAFTSDKSPESNVGENDWVRTRVVQPLY